MCAYKGIGNIVNASTHSLRRIERKMSEGEGGGGGEDVIKTKKWTNDGTTNLTVSRERERKNERKIK